MWEENNMAFTSYGKFNFLHPYGQNRNNKKYFSVIS